VDYSSRIPHARVSIYLAGCRLRATNSDSELSPPDVNCHMTLPRGSCHAMTGGYHALVAVCGYFTLSRQPMSVDCQST